MSDQPPILPNVQVPAHPLDDLGVTPVGAAFEDRDNFVRNLATVLTGGAASNGAAPPVTPSGSASGRAPLVTLEQIKMHCQIELDQTDQDDYLKDLEMAARLHTENYLRYTVDAADVGENIKQAVLVLIADWYRDRELMRDGRWADAPIAWKSLLSLERDYPVY